MTMTPAANAARLRFLRARLEHENATDAELLARKSGTPKEQRDAAARLYNAQRELRDATAAWKATGYSGTTR